MKGRSAPGACVASWWRAVPAPEQLSEQEREETVARTFSMQTTVDPPSLLARARRVAGENGATLVGGDQSGRFSHDMVRGEYRMAGRTVTVTITEKHWLVPWSVVESRIEALVR